MVVVSVKNLEKSNSLGIIGFVLSLFSLFIPILGIFIGIIAIVFSILQIRKTKTGLAIAGLVISIVAIIFHLGSLYIIAAGGGISVFKETSVNGSCQNNKDYCELVGLYDSLKKGVLQEVQFFPEEKTICNYYCVGEELHEKQINDKTNWEIVCTWPESQAGNYDFTFTKKYDINSPSIKLQLSYIRTEPITFSSITGLGDFSGTAKIITEWDDAGVGHQTMWGGITNNNPGDKNVNGQIEFVYVFKGESKSFTSTCKSNIS